MKFLAQCGVSWHTKPMIVMRTEGWCSLGIGLFCVIALDGCALLHPSSSPSTASVENRIDPAVDQNLVESLQRQLRERNKRIAELSSQLDALKKIDQDTRERRTSSRTPASFKPSTTDRDR